MKVKHDQLEVYFDQISSNGYLKPYSLKEVEPGKLQLTNPDKHIELMFAYSLKKTLDVSFSQIEQGISKSSIKFDGIVNVEKIPLGAISFDTVVLIRLSW